MKEITVRVTKNYGVEAIYPADETAETFARMLGTRTLTRTALQHIKTLGYDIKVQEATLALA
jgi:hypothetical protein